MHRKLFIHAGHGKTGSSWLQSSLALSNTQLREHGIAYPDHPELEIARAGLVTSGNIKPADVIAGYKTALTKYPDAHTFVYSNENFFSALLNRAGLLENVAKLDVDIRLLLFIRNPVLHALSTYVEIVKGRGYTESLDAFLPTYNRLDQVLAFISKVRGQGVDLEILNYSNHRKDLKGAFARVLGVGSECLVTPPNPVINRGLTRSELELQRAFNAACGSESSQLIGGPLCNELPDIPSELPRLSREAYARFADSVDEKLNALNKHIPEAEQYQLEAFEDIGGRIENAEDELLTFRKEQIEVFARAISDKLLDSKSVSAAPPAAAQKHRPRGLLQRLFVWF